MQVSRVSDGGFSIGAIADHEYASRARTTIFPTTAATKALSFSMINECLLADRDLVRKVDACVASRNEHDKTVQGRFQTVLAGYWLTNP